MNDFYKLQMFDEESSSPTARKTEKYQD